MYEDYYYDDGDDYDYEKAREWYQKAADQGFVDAIEALDGLNRLNDRW